MRAAVLIRQDGQRFWLMPDINGIQTGRLEAVSVPENRVGAPWIATRGGYRAGV